MPIAKDPSRALAGVYILVVEDDEDSRNILTAVLRYYGAHVVATASADAALDRFRVVRPNVVVTDIAMPGRDGIWLLREMRTLPGAEKIAVVAISAVADPHDLVSAGFDKVLTKPVEPRALCDAVREVMDMAA